MPGVYDPAEAKSSDRRSLSADGNGAKKTAPERSGRGLVLKGSVVMLCRLVTRLLALSRGIRMLCRHFLHFALTQIVLLCLLAHPAWAHDTGEVHVHFGASAVNGTTALLAGIFAALAGTVVYRQAYFTILRNARDEKGRYEPSSC